MNRRTSCTTALATATMLAFACPLHAADRTKPGVEACASASEAAQTLLDEHKLLSARQRLLVCTQTSCPAAIKRDCDELLSKVDATMPSIVLSVRDGSGQDVVDAQVTIDGAPLPNALQGRALPLDPGSHTLHFERAGAAPQDLVVVAHEGERARDVVVHLAPRVALTVAPPVVHESVSATSSGPSWPAWVLGGVGVAGIGAFIAFAANGQSQYNQCTANGCSQSESASLERERAAGFASLGVGLAASAASVWFVVAHGSSKAGAGSARVGVGVDGSALRVSGSF